MEAVLIVSLVIVIVAAAMLARAVRVVPQFRAGIVIRLGRYHRTLQAGLNLVMPIIDQVQLVDLQERSLVLRPVTAHTDDSQTVALEGVVIFQVISPEKATFETPDPAGDIERAAERVLQEAVARETLQSALASRGKINDALLDSLRWVARNWGVEIHRVDVTCRQAS